jgi:hypothetical protein
MSMSKPIRSPFASHFKLSSKRCPLSDEERNEMKKAPYKSSVGRFIYVIVCMRLDITYAISVVSRFLFNFGK